MKANQSKFPKIGFENFTPLTSLTESKFLDLMDHKLVSYSDTLQMFLW